MHKRDRETAPMEKLLFEFLERWIATRVAQLDKFKARMEYYRPQPTMKICFEEAERKVAHYQLELAVLQELKARALPTGAVASMPPSDCQQEPTRSGVQNARSSTGRDHPAREGSRRRSKRGSNAAS